MQPIIPTHIVEQVAALVTSHLPNAPRAFYNALLDVDPPRFDGLSPTELETLFRQVVQESPGGFKPAPYALAWRLLERHATLDCWRDPIPTAPTVEARS